MTKQEKLEKYVQMASSKNVDDVNLCGVLIGKDPDFSYSDIIDVMRFIPSVVHLYGEWQTSGERRYEFYIRFTIGQLK